MPGQYDRTAMGASPKPQGSRRLRNAPGGLGAATKRRARAELVTAAVFNPLARIVTSALLPLRVPPAVVVLGNAIAGVAAALAVFRGELVAAAVLLQVKTVLDNADGQLARAGGRTSALGRYLDTEADLVVNGLVFAGLAHETGAPLLSTLAFCALTLVLSANFNADVLYRRARGETVVTQPLGGDEGRLARGLEWLYSAFFAPQDRLFQAIWGFHLARLLAKARDSASSTRVTLAFHDGGTVAVHANLGLSTQLFVLGICLLLGVPTAYLWLTLGCLALLPVLELRRERLGRRALAR
jgi:hypothetical protein